MYMHYFHRQWLTRALVVLDLEAGFTIEREPMEGNLTPYQDVIGFGAIDLFPDLYCLCLECLEPFPFTSSQHLTRFLRGLFFFFGRIYFLPLIVHPFENLLSNFISVKYIFHPTPESKTNCSKRNDAIIRLHHLLDSALTNIYVFCPFY